MKIKYLTIKDVMKIHNEVIKIIGGNDGKMLSSNLEFIISEAHVPKELERTAAILFFGILTGHPFKDGNKRTAVVSTETFLLMNKKKLVATDDDLFELTKRISEGSIKFEDVVVWFAKRIGE